MKKVLLTGAAGFIGSHCLKYFLENTDWEIVCLDSYRHKGDPQRYIDVVGLDFSNPRVRLLRADLSVPITPVIENLIGDVDYIVNMASDSAVERSTQNPTACLENNYNLVVNMLEFARKVKPEIFFQISTDEVYGEAKPKQAHKEWDVILPSNPYAASKAAQEAVAIAYWRTYGVPVVITNTMNNIGEGQDCEKFLPVLVKKINAQEEVSIYGDHVADIGTRFYLHAANHADAIVFLSKIAPASYELHAERPDRYNVTGDIELSNWALANLVADIIGKDFKWKLIQSDSARPGYDRRYALDGSKLEEMGWVHPLTFEESIVRVVEWYLQHPQWTVG